MAAQERELDGVDCDDLANQLPGARPAMTANEQMSKSERYMAFLLRELPRLEPHALARRWLRPGFWRKIKRRDVLTAALKEVSAREQDGLCLEFGTFEGNSMRHSAKMLPGRRFYGFDSFEGFPDDGRPDWKQDFSVAELPDVPENVTLMKGYFSETLAPFLAANTDPVAFVHVDCDIYSSTIEVLGPLHAAGLLVPGVVVAFDELINYPNYLWNEMLALFELTEDTGLSFEWLALHDKVYGVEQSIGMLEAGTYPNWHASRANGYWEQAAMVITEPGASAMPLSAEVAAKARELAPRFDAVSERHR